MNAGHASGSGRRKARAPADIHDKIRATLDRVVTTGTSIGAPLSGAVVGGIGIHSHSVPLTMLGASGIAIGVLAMWQLWRGRPNAVLLNILSAVGVGASSIFLSHQIAAAFAAAILVFALTGVPTVHGKQAAWYMAVMVAAFAAHPVYFVATSGGIDEAHIVAYSIMAACFGYGFHVFNAIGLGLHRSEARYQFLFEHAPVALWDNDFSDAYAWMAQLRSQGVEDLGTYLREHPSELDVGIGLVATIGANEAAARLLGASDPAELAGPFPPEVIDESARRIFFDQFVTLWDAGTEGETEYTGVRIDGSEFRGVLTWAGRPAAGPAAARVVSAVSDITALRKTEAELESTETLRRALLGAIPDLLFVCDADGTYLNYHVPDRSVSQRAASKEDLYVPPSEFLGKRPIEVLPPELAEQIMIANATALETDSVQRLEYRLPVGGRERYWEMRVSPIGGEPRVLALVRDITDTVEARIELERLIKSKDDFIAAVSHEIRTPLTGIVGFAQILTGELGDELDPDERRSMIEALANQSSDLTNIVEDLLVAAKADLGRLTVAEVPIDLRAQAAQVVEAWEPSRIQLPEITGTSVRCLGDPHRVRQVIRNLLTNARRYGGQNIRLEIGAGPDIGHVLVADDGPGIPEDQVEEAFLPYHRVAPRDGLTAALGIGLPISRRLARLMGGDLVYERVDGESRFCLTLPLADPAHPAADDRTGAAAEHGLLGARSGD
jgi:signal transduction histidine kinase